MRKHTLPWHAEILKAVALKCVTGRFPRLSFNPQGHFNTPCLANFDPQSFSVSASGEILRKVIEDEGKQPNHA